VNSSCETVRSLLVEDPGCSSRHDPAVERHLEKCDACRQFAEAEERLATIFSDASPPPDPVLQRRVIMTIKAFEVRRRRLALLPVAASAIFVLFGVTLMGGVPGASLMASLPAWTGGGWSVVTAMLMDIVGAMQAVASGVAGVISVSMLFGAFTIVVVGIGVMVLALKRWKRSAPWSVRS